MMAVRAAGSVFLALLSVLFPAAVGQPWTRYKHKETCGLKGSSVELACSYTNSTETEVLKAFWSKHWQAPMKPEDLSLVPEYSGRMEYANRGANDCTLTLKDLRESDSAYYYFICYFRYLKNGKRKSIEKETISYGHPGVLLNVPPAAVSVLVEEIVGETFERQRVTVEEQRMTEGQKILMTCQPTCAESLDSDPAYVWYKNGLHLNNSRTNSRFLYFDALRSKDMGSYSCAVIGYEALRSPAIIVSVQYGPRNTTVLVILSGNGTKEGSVMTLTCSSDANPPVHEYTWYKTSTEEETVLQTGRGNYIIVAASVRDGDMYLCEAKNKMRAQNSTALNLNTYLKPRVKTTSIFSQMFLASVCAGLAVAVLVVFFYVGLRMKRKHERAVPEAPGPGEDPYTALDTRTMSLNYGMLDNLKGCSDAECPVDGNVQVHNALTGENDYEVI